MARNPFFTFINILGLGIGFASFFALWDFSLSELQSDHYHNDADRIARIGNINVESEPGKGSIFTLSFNC